MKKTVNAKSRATIGTANVPTDLQRALRANAEVRTAFEALPASHQREYIKWIEEAKKDETRRGRIQKTLAMLLKS